MIFTKCLKICTNQWNRGRLLNYRILWQYWTCWFSYIISLYAGLFYLNLSLSLYIYIYIYKHSEWECCVFMALSICPKLLISQQYVVFKYCILCFASLFAFNIQSFIKQRSQNENELTITMSARWSKWVRVDQNEYELTEQLGRIDQMSTNWSYRWEQVDQNDNELT